ncbi:hypothetical protein [Streptomyces sp. NPDC047981]|uniref:hypothetical protein n=1 Tax=Streptomyces sp. NPDC047981 TaxID=3154610 RepID=UPI00342C3582
MTQPSTTEQLLNLADRAERGPLTGDEAARLRNSISQLYGLFERYRDRSNEYADRYLKQRERAERAEALLREFVSLANLTHQYPAMGGHDCLGQNLTCAGCALRDKIRAALDEHQEQLAAAHHYLSTGCLHDQHAYCQGKSGQAGPKSPAQCKFCQAPCVCPCHTSGEQEGQT